jgi:hypothetical protein
MHDYSGGAGAAVQVVNPNPWPVVVNTEGQALGGYEDALVGDADPVAVKALDRGWLHSTPVAAEAEHADSDPVDPEGESPSAPVEEHAEEEAEEQPVRAATRRRKAAEAE